MSNLVENPQGSGKKPNPKALTPILVFLILYLGTGIYFEYIHPQDGQMGFYVKSVVMAFGLVLIVAFMQNPSLSFDEKIHICARGIGDDNITIMLFIFLMAGAFSGIAQEAGGVESTANMLLNIIPGRFAIPGLFDFLSDLHGHGYQCGNHYRPGSDCGISGTDCRF